MPAQFVVDAFTDGPFSGNPAAVVPLDDWLPAEIMQMVAAQNNLSETAFLLQGAKPEIRWFTPTDEIDLCGHATLATAHVLFSELGDRREVIELSSLGGPLRVSRSGVNYLLDFPAIDRDEADPSPAVVAAAEAALDQKASATCSAGGWLIIEVESREAVLALTPDFDQLAGLPGGLAVVTARGEGRFDVSSRVFAPGVGIPEDPVTGSAHCALIPYWCERMEKDSLVFEQASARGGVIEGSWQPDGGRVLLSGECQTFLRGEISIDL